MVIVGNEIIPDGARKLPYKRFADIIRDHVVSIGLDPSLYGTHSNRSGGATTLAPRHDVCAYLTQCQIPSVRVVHEGHFVVVSPILVAHGPSGPSVRASPSKGIEVPLLRPAPLSDLSAGREGRGDWLHGSRLVGFSRPDVARWSVASG
jgi:hypothetical protein